MTVDKDAARKAAHVRHQATYADNLKQAGYSVRSMWMDQDTLALWERLRPQYGGQVKALAAAIRKLAEG